MKITFILPPLSMAGGIRVIAIYSERLRRRGHDVHVISVPPQPKSLKHRLKGILMGQNWPFKINRNDSYFKDLNIKVHLLDAYRPVDNKDVPDSDVIVATWWRTAEWVSELSRHKGAKAYFIQHHEVFDYLPKERSAATYYLPMHKITISRWLVDLMNSKYGDQNVSHVPNSVDTNQFYTTPRGKQVTPTVGMLYSIIPWKGCRISLKAFALASHKIPNLKLISFGTDNIDKSLPLPTGATYHKNPKQNRIKDIYSQCDVWLCGSIAEGFHLPPLEAMACRCPVVSSMVGGPLDIIENGTNGYLVPVEDVESLTNRLIDVLSLDDNQWHTMSEAAYETSRSYTWDDATDLLEKALLTAIARNERGDFDK
jgi:glycosyltransferase involved in cell wall biosynthesis